MKIRILGPAEEDLEGGYRFYESQSTGLGSLFLNSLYSDIDSLAYFGGIHQIVSGFHRQFSKRFPFAVYYRIVILRLPHRSDDWASISLPGQMRKSQSWRSDPNWTTPGEMTWDTKRVVKRPRLCQSCFWA